MREVSLGAFLVDELSHHIDRRLSRLRVLLNQSSRLDSLLYFSRHISRKLRGASGRASRQAVQAPSGGTNLPMTPPTFPMRPSFTAGRCNKRIILPPHSYSQGGTR